MLNCATCSKFLVSTAISALLVFGNPVSSSRASIEGGVGATIIIGKLQDSVSKLIQEAQAAGDFLTWRLGIELRDTIDAWEKANSNTLDKAFNGLTQQQQDALNKFDTIFTRVSKERVQTVADVNDLTTTLAQIASDIIPWDDNAHIFRYEPRVIVPDINESVLLHIRGVNLDGQRFSQNSLKNEGVSIAGPTRQEIIVNIDRSKLEFKDSDSTQLDLTVEYVENPNDWFQYFRARKVSKVLPLRLLPKKLGAFEITTKIAQQRKEERIFTLDLGQFKGRNKRIERAVPSPDSAEGWRINTTKRNEIALLDRGGDKGRCEGIKDETVTPNGFTMYAHVDNRDRDLNIGIDKRDAHVNCAVNIPQFRLVDEVVNGPKFDGILSWTKDQSIDLPPGAKPTVTITLYDNRKIVWVENGEDSLIRGRFQGNSVVLSPKPPSDF